MIVIEHYGCLTLSAISLLPLVPYIPDYYSINTFGFDQANFILDILYIYTPEGFSHYIQVLTYGLDSGYPICLDSVREVFI